MKENYIHELNRNQVNWFLKGGIVEFEEIGKDGERITREIKLARNEVNYYETIIRKGIEALRKEEEHRNRI